MTKKIFGCLIFLFGVFSIGGSVINGSLFADNDSVAETYGYLTGTIIAFSLFVLSAIFLF